MKDFLFEGDVPYVAMATRGMNYELREPRLRGEAPKSIKASDQSGRQTHASARFKIWTKLKKIPVRADISSLFGRDGGAGGGVETVPHITCCTQGNTELLERDVQDITHISQ